MMKTELIRIYDPAEDAEGVLRAGDILAHGGLVAIPTETVYGLAANAYDEAAVKAVYAAKGRPSDNPMIVHIAELSALPELVTAIPENAKILAEAFWPGPLTMVLPRSSKIPLTTTGGLETVAIRMPSHPVARAVIRAAGVPLAAPAPTAAAAPAPPPSATVWMTCGAWWMPLWKAMTAPSGWNPPFSASCRMVPRRCCAPALSPRRRSSGGADASRSPRPSYICSRRMPRPPAPA